MLIQSIENQVKVKRCEVLPQPKLMKGNRLGVVECLKFQDGVIHELLLLKKKRKEKEKKSVKKKIKKK